MTAAGDHTRAVARRIETMLAEIAYAEDRSYLLDLQQRATEDRSYLLDLQQRATEMISELHSALDRARLQERVEDAVNARMQEIET